ncbi:CAP-Gly domain-containing linker protein, putative [Ixodes scapularis]|uniref:CAP-Gly domain-containing linker protein, putative n=1 Tax=Ixodes scapularis TaxID=6945 RepID=B7PXU8_IXOSC|nr:CAP-Gly domain-containing linker protein, putative [Ixodes scapularis]|eukprot:XP_002401880.1 CAP-Gly domain-containing linker protein, putative [Ixodes scapularis]
MPSPSPLFGFRETGGPFNNGSADDFIIGDRVWVNGTKPGYIQFLGETQFSSGDWAGVVLDEPVGKNDGSVNGVRYFQCEPRRGVFARPERLSRFPGPGANGTNTTATLVAPGKTQVTTTRVSSPTGSTRSSPRAVTMHTSTTLTDCGLRVGDRVIVNASSGMKAGTLRFMGPTEFATGQWAGVELDEPVGKNDGSVAGKKYFRCPARHGLFAPLHKVAREGGHTSTTTTTTTRTTRITSQPRRAGSQESLHSSLSSASARAGKSTRPLASAMVASQNSLQRLVLVVCPIKDIVNYMYSLMTHKVALKEKEEHIEQLLKEHDLERAEVARAAVQVEEVEQKMAALRAEHQRYVEETEQRAASLHQLLEEHEQERAQLTALNSDLQRKLEDLQFRIEEQEILHSDNDQDHSTGELIAQYKDETQKLKDALASSQARVAALEAKQAEDQGTVSKLREELLARDETLLRLEASLEQRAKELLVLRDRAFELEEGMAAAKAREESQQQAVEDLNARLAQVQTDYDFLSEESRIIKSEAADQQRQLTSAEEQCAQLQGQKRGLEEELATLRLTASGGSQQVAQLNAHLQERERQVESLESQVRTLSQECERARQEAAHEAERLQAAAERATSDHGRQVAALEQRLADLECKLEERMSRCRTLEQTASDLRGELEQQGGALADKLAAAERRAEQLVAQLQQAKEEALEERRLRERDRDDLSAQTSDRESQLASAQAELERLRAEFSAHREDLAKQLRENQEETLAVNRMHDQMKNQLGMVDDLRRLLAEAEGAKSDLSARVSQLQAELASATAQAIDRKADSNNEAEVKALKARIEELQNSTEEELRAELERTRGRAEEDKRKLGQLAKEMEQLERELERSRLGRSVVESLEADKRQLESKLAELRASAPVSANGKSALASSLGGSSGGDGDHEAVKEERDSLQMQNDELKSQVEILKAGPTLDDVDINLNGIKGMSAPRLFCDICDRFDVHDTADCPVQCSIEEEMSSHSHHSVARHSSRPYCNVCEVFGHTSAECDPSETF